MVLREIRRHLVVIDHRLERLLVAVKTQMPDFGLGQQIEHAVHHAQPGPQNGDQADARVHFDALGGGQRRLHRYRAQGQITGCLVGQDHGQFVDNRAEAAKIGGEIAQLG